jgi:hypothetical protein
MDAIRLCKGCRQPLPENAPEGLCPRCLAKAALGTESPARAERTPLDPAEPSGGPGGAGLLASGFSRLALIGAVWAFFLLDAPLVWLAWGRVKQPLGGVVPVAART